MGERVRTFLWPRRSFMRSAQYFIKRILRLTATPHAIAAGVAAGAFASFTPFLGFHFIIAAALAWLISGNMIASALGTAVGNPITFPFIWAVTLQAGRTILGVPPGDFKTQVHLGKMLAHLDFATVWTPLLKPMTVGAIPVGLAFAAGFYFLTRWAVAGFREQRRKRLAERARRRAAAAPMGLAVNG